MTKKQIREAYLSQRHTRIGTTDVGAILGMSPYANAYDIWLHKTGKLQMPAEDGKNQAITAGIAFEDGVLDWSEELLGPMKRKVIILPEPNAEIPLGTELDAVLTKTGEPVNAKTAGLIGPLDKDKWGDEGTDQVPELYYIQAQIEMHLAQREVQHLPAFLGGRGFAYYRIEFSKSVMDAILERLFDFWQNNVLKDIPPSDVVPQLEIVKYRIRKANKIAEVPQDLMQDYVKASAAEKDAKKIKESIQGQLLATMEDSEATQFIEGVGQITYFEVETKRLDTAKLKQFHADVFEECSKVSKSRKMIVRKKPLPKLITEGE